MDKWEVEKNKMIEVERMTFRETREDRGKKKTRV